MKRFNEMTKEELDKYDYTFKIYQNGVNFMIDLLDLEGNSFKRVFEKVFENSINNRKDFKKD